MFKQHELRYIQKVSSGENISAGHHFWLKGGNELNLVFIEDEASFIYFGDSEIYEFKQTVESARS